MKNERYSQIRLFDACLKALEKLEERDSVLFGWRRARFAISHRLAQYLEQILFPSQAEGFSEGFVFDINAPIKLEKSTVTSDILLHDRNQKRAMALMWRNSYLTNSDLATLVQLKAETGCTLVLAIARLVYKPYMLIYRINEQSIDYYHYFHGSGGRCEFSRQRSLDLLAGEDLQLTLGIKRRRKV